MGTIVALLEALGMLTEVTLGYTDESLNMAV
jgi:hypothetical protein